MSKKNLYSADNTKLSLALKSFKYHKTAIIISAFSFAVMVFSPLSTEWLRYESIAVSNGQVWRILTANLCHSNWNHWLLNISGLLLMDIFLRPVLQHKCRLYLLLFCMIGSVSLLHFFMSLKWYVGLSGALHGYILGGAILSWQTAKKMNAAIISIILAKVLIENVWQINQSTEELIAANVIEESHLFGALSALVFCAIYALHKKYSTKNSSSQDN